MTAAAAKPRARRAAPRRVVRVRPGWRRWLVAAALAVGMLLLLPIVHAFAGDLGVLIVGSAGLGFLLGRWSARFP